MHIFWLTNDCLREIIVIFNESANVKQVKLKYHLLPKFHP